jgi:hypothetical protein
MFFHALAVNAEDVCAWISVNPNALLISQYVTFFIDLLCPSVWRCMCMVSPSTQFALLISKISKYVRYKI